MSAQPSEQTELMKQQLEVMKEILRWVRFSGSDKAIALLNSALDTDEKRLAYQLSDGKMTSIKISEMTGVRQQRVSTLWREWAAIGLGEAIAASGGSRFKRSFDLKMLGIPVPEVKQQGNDQATTATPTVENVQNGGESL